MFTNLRLTKLTAKFAPALLAASIALTGCGAPTASPASAGDMAGSYEMAAAEEESATASSYSTGGSATVNDEPYDAVFYENYGVNPFVDTEDDNLSTFAMDVDTASYTVARRYLRDGNLPDPASVRTEEFINYFKHDYTPPAQGAFAIHMEGAPSPFGGERHKLVRVGLQGKIIDDADRMDASLVFVIDVSGSMASENRLETAKASLRMLVEKLRSSDEVAIVVYGNQAHTILPPTPASASDRILQAIDQVTPNGSTNAEEGLLMGYELAEQMLQRANEERIVRLILCSDGVANVGATGPDSLLNKVQRYVDQGITLSTVGFGMGNYNDVLMEQLANDGDGNYAYVDTLDESHRFFVENLTGMLQVIAKDAKVQVEFNPEVVQSYRLLGYENRRVDDDDFRNDAVDAGEVGAGHSVTALYEIKLHKAVEEQMATSPAAVAGSAHIRYFDMARGEVVETSQMITLEDIAPNFGAASASFQLDAAIAEYAEILKESYWAQDGSLADVHQLAQQVAVEFGQNEDVAEFVNLVALAEQIAGETAQQQ